MDGSREARRRRIAERGTDRLALITGQIRTLPPGSESDQPPGSHSHTASCPPSISQVQLPSSPSQILDPPQSEDRTSGSFLPNRDSISETRDIVGPFLRKCGSNPETSEVAALNPDGNGPSVQVPASAQNHRVTSSYMDQLFQPLIHLHNLFTSVEVKDAISASERTRNLCSLVVAILVVLAYVGFPVIGCSFFKSIIFFRPLYFLLLTNITIVIARLLEKQNGLQRAELQSIRNSSVSEYGLADQLGTALELGLVLKNVLTALFMDCSIYSTTVICGFSLAQSLGW